MIELIALIILLISSFGILFIVFRKIPILLTLPEVGVEKENLISKFKKIISKFNPFKNFSLAIFLEKNLRRIRIFFLKTDNQISSWLKKIKEKYQKKEVKDNYWEEIKKSTKNS